jgi:hypothetical protein
MSFVRCECGWSGEFRNPYIAAIKWEEHCNSGQCSFQNLAMEIITGRKEKSLMAGRVFEGKTEDLAPILGAKFWQQDTVIEGTVINKFETSNGTCWTIRLNKELILQPGQTYPATNEKHTVDAVSVGSLKGFTAALESAMGTEHLQRGDYIKIKCTGHTDTGKESEMVKFAVKVIRPDAAEQKQAATGW